VINIKELFNNKDTFRKHIPDWRQTNIHVAEALQDDIAGTTMREYNLELKIGRSIICRAEDFNMCRQNAIRLMQHDLYGEMRPMLYELTDAIYREDSETCHNVIKTMEQTMFED
jgi:hypothetical protein